MKNKLSLDFVVSKISLFGIKLVNLKFLTCKNAAVRLIQVVQSIIDKASKLVTYLALGFKNYASTPWTKYRPVKVLCLRLERLTLQKLQFFASLRPPISGQLMNEAFLHDHAHQLYLEQTRVRDLLLTGFEGHEVGDPRNFDECAFGAECPINIDVRITKLSTRIIIFYFLR